MHHNSIPYEQSQTYLPPSSITHGVAGEPTAQLRVVPAVAAQGGSKGAVGIVPPLATVTEGVGYGSVLREFLKGIGFHPHPDLPPPRCIDRRHGLQFMALLLIMEIDMGNFLGSKEYLKRPILLVRSMQTSLTSRTDCNRAVNI